MAPREIHGCSQFWKRAGSEFPAFGVWALAFAADEVTSLPGWSGPLPSRQFSGYLDVGASKHLHYWLVESEGAPSTDPTVLWLNGGPGCSSLDGFLYEHGPFRTDPANPHKLVRFPQTWAKVANMLYLEAPAGVGYSYCAAQVAGGACANTDISTAKAARAPPVAPAPFASTLEAGVASGDTTFTNRGDVPVVAKIYGWAFAAEMAAVVALWYNGLGWDDAQVRTVIEALRAAQGWLW